MNIADLFLNLGVKGNEKTVGALSGIQKGLKDTSSVALETKVALAGAVFALERLFAASGQKGTDLVNFNSMVGVSMKTLQQYEYAARQAGVANEEVAGTFKSLQTAMTKTLMGEGAPKGLAHVADVLGISIGEEDINEFAKQPEKLIQILQKYAQAEKNVGLRNETLKSFGIGDGMVAAMNRNAFNPAALAKAPTYSDNEAQSLDKANIAWSNLRNKIEMSIGKFNAEHGNELVGGISKITDQVIKLAEAFEKFAEKIHLFEWFGKSIEGWTTILKGFAAAITAVAELKDSGGVAEATISSVKDWALGTREEQAQAETQAKMKNIEDETAKKYRDRAKAGGPMPAHISPTTGYPKAMDQAEARSRSVSFDNPRTRPTSTPPARPTATVIPINSVARPNVASTVKNQTANTTNVVNQNLNFAHDGKNAQQTASDVKKATKDAYRANGAQGRVN